MTKSITTIRAGETKMNPLTIVLIANPWLEAPFNSGQFIADPIMADQAAFNTCVDYIEGNLFCTMEGQKEQLLADGKFVNKVKLVSIFDDTLISSSANALIAQDDMSNILIPRRDQFTPFLSLYNLKADVAYAVSNSKSHSRASAWFTTDDDTQAGVVFQLDGVPLTHRYYSAIPGTVAMHVSDTTGMTAIHEFGHALSSYSNGSIVDLYVDSPTAVNNKLGRPIPGQFDTYQASTYVSDASRGPLGYPPGWDSYHCELNNSVYPAIMDNYWCAPQKAYSQ